MYEELAGNIAAVEERQQQASEGLFAFVNEGRQAVDQEHQQREALEARFQQQTGQVEQVQRDLAGSQEDLRAVRTQSEAAEARQLQALQETRQAFTLAQRQTGEELRGWVEKHLEQRVREMDDALQDFNKEVAADLAAIRQRVDEGKTRMGQFAAQLEAVKSAALEWKPRVDTQDQVMVDLQAKLQSEVQAREALAEQVAALIAERAGGKPRKKLEA